MGGSLNFEASSNCYIYSTEGCLATYMLAKYPTESESGYRTRLNG